MLFIHTKHVLEKAHKKASEDEFGDMDEEEEWYLVVFVMYG